MGQMPSPDRTHTTRRFLVHRTEDISGKSGVGYVAEGIQFHDGQAVVSWFGRYHSLEIHPTVAQFELLHSHGGRTQVIWSDDTGDTYGKY